MTLDQLLNLNSTELKKLSTAELEKILAPYYTASRQALLPPDKPEKLGLQVRFIEAYINANAEKLGIKLPLPKTKP